MKRTYQTILTHGRKQSTPKKLGKNTNKTTMKNKQNYFSSLNFTDVNHLPYCVLWNRPFQNTTAVPVHSEFREKGTKYIKHRQNKFLKSQKGCLLQFFTV